MCPTMPSQRSLLTIVLYLNWVRANKSALTSSQGDARYQATTSDTSLVFSMSFLAGSFGCSASPCPPPPLLLLHLLENMLRVRWGAGQLPLHWCWRDGGGASNAGWFFIKLEFQGSDHTYCLQVKEGSKHPEFGKALGAPCTAPLTLSLFRPQTI